MNNFFIVLITLRLSASLTGISLLSTVNALWSCGSDSDCSSLSDSVCVSGTCVCPVGKQAVLGGSACVDVAPYHTSECFEDHQCMRLFTGFQCRGNEGITGNCHCQPGFHFFLGRCWPSKDFGETCTRDEECMNVLRDPYSMSCNTTCQCSDGYYLRQRGECRRAGLAVGDGCVLDQDCLFQDGACDVPTFTCYNTTAIPDPEPETEEKLKLQAKIELLNVTYKMADLNEMARQHGDECASNDHCDNPFVCSILGICVCPIGYYYHASVNGGVCLAELGSPSTEEQCVGIFSVVQDGICTCPANFYAKESMRDCVKVARFITDSCLSDENCLTFGAQARCGAPQPPWGLRHCECAPELAVWDPQRNMCRLFAGIGESCEVDSDCMAGELEIQCQLDDAGYGYCACPAGLAEFEGLCITAGLELGDSCQVTQECGGTDNTICEQGRCSCDNGYQEVDDFCAPIIGGTCIADSDCVIQDTICRNDTNTFTCQCDDRFVEYSDACWPLVSGFEAECTVTAQCTASLGESSSCSNGRCSCMDGHHFRDGACWPVTGLFESCSRSSQCFLGSLTDRVVCRNSLCQCDFTFPYSEELDTCTSSSSMVATSAVILTTLFTLL